MTSGMGSKRVVVMCHYIIGISLLALVMLVIGRTLVIQGKTHACQDMTHPTTLWCRYR